MVNIFDASVFSKYVFAKKFFGESFINAQRLSDDRSNPTLRNPDLVNNLMHPLNVVEVIKRLNCRIRYYITFKYFFWINVTFNFLKLFLI